MARVKGIRTGHTISWSIDPTDKADHMAADILGLSHIWEELFPNKDEAIRYKDCINRKAITCRRQLQRERTTSHPLTRVVYVHMLSSHYATVLCTN